MMLRWLASSVYPAFLPAPPAASASVERYLEELWREAPRRAALAHIASALGICLLPPLLLGRCCLFPSLSQREKEILLERMSGSRWYALRLAVAAARTAALLAALRDPGDRARLLR